MSNLLKTVSKKAGKKIGKKLGKAGKAIDDFLTPKSLTERQKTQRRRTGSRLKQKSDPLKAFAGSTDPAIKKARQEAIDKAREQAKKTRGAQKKRQQKAREEAINKRKNIIKKGAAGTGATAAVIGLTNLGSDDKSKTKTKTKEKTFDQRKEDRQMISDIAKFSTKKNQERLDKERRRKEDAAKDLTWKDFSGTGALKRAKEYGLKHYKGADGKKKATIDKSEIREGETMTEAFNRILGKKPRKKNMGGMMKSKMASKGGKMGGKMAPGMMGGGMANKKPVPESNKGLKKLPKDVRNKMGYMKNGGMAKKGYSKGGAVKSAKKKRSTGAALRGFGAEIR